MANRLQAFQINLVALRNKDYQYQWWVEDDFFASFAHSPVERGRIEVLVHLQKSETMVQVAFDLQGEVILTCDRSLDEFAYPLSLSEKMIFQFGEEDEIVSENLEVIARDKVLLDLSQYVYEYIGLAIPMKRLHPRYQEEALADEETETLVYQSGAAQEEVPEAESPAQADPRWEALKKLRKN
ncbi:MAG: DUF177 domain-containing protein [Microscillaceae bacterium]